MRNWFPRPRRSRSSRSRALGPVQTRLALEALEDRCVLSSGFAQTNLISDLPGLAQLTLTSLVNPWGIAAGPTDPFWISDNGAGVSMIDNGSGQPLTPGGDPIVAIAPPRGERGALGEPTGVVFNGSSGFVVAGPSNSGASQFLFATEDGTILGWSPGADLGNAIVAIDNSASGAVYTGLALATDAFGQSFLYAANFRAGTIDVFDSSFRAVNRPGAFRDPTLPSGFAPFGIEAIGGKVFVTYAQQDASRYNNVPGPGNGFVDEYDADGNLLRRFASGGPLNSPWGMALAPDGFGAFSHDLLIGNFGDGRINVFDPASGRFLGQLADAAGNPIAIPNLWGLIVGNGQAGGDSHTLYFTAGIGGTAHGLFGSLRSLGAAAPERPLSLSELGNDYPLPPATSPPLQAVLTTDPGLVPPLPFAGGLPPAPAVSLVFAAPSPSVASATLGDGSSPSSGSAGGVAQPFPSAFIVESGHSAGAVDLLLAVSARTVSLDPDPTLGGGNAVETAATAAGPSDVTVVTAADSGWIADLGDATPAAQAPAQPPAQASSERLHEDEVHAALNGWLHPSAVFILLASGGGFALYQKRSRSEVEDAAVPGVVPAEGI
jgi:uncharacterized protein (TIGR03118 family)